MTKVKDLGPLDWRIAITDKAGRPTPEFQRRWALQRANNGLIGSVTLGSGPPHATPVPTDGSEYIDISTTPYTLYVGSAGTWHKVGVVKFTDLSDAPHSYSGQANKLVQVNPSATGLQFTTQAAGFSFYAGGLLTANEELGSGVWPVNMTFNNTLAYVVTSVFPATASAVLNIRILVSGLYVTIGTITFGIGATNGVLNWPSPITVVAGNPISLWAPTSADATLSSIAGLIDGLAG